jgi:tripartite-type tricarboxylate transporter receptor subunit TctC
MLFRRTALALPALLLARAARAENWKPGQQLRIIAGAAAGGTTDIMGRMLAQHLQVKWGTPVVVENRTGAGGNIGASVVAHAPGDGYGFLFSNIGLAVVRALYASLDYDPMRELKPVTIVAESPMVLLVPPNAPWHTVAELVRDARANPGKFSYVSAGGGGALQLVTLL